MTVLEVLNFLDKLYPTNTACEFDNVGLLVGNSGNEVTGILVTLDCTVSAIDNAIRSGSNLIVTHHPVIFNGLKSVTENSVVYKLVRNNINVISMHTNLDMGKGGVNDCLCKTLELKNIKMFCGSDGFTLRSATCSFANSDELAKHIKKSLGFKVAYINIEKPIKKVLVCSGSGGDYLNDAIRCGFDALITSDVKHNVLIDAENADFPIFDCGHFATENVVIESLKQNLSKKFKTIKINSYSETKIKSI